MNLRIFVPKEQQAGEHRVALVPDVVGRLVKLGFSVTVERGAGAGAHCPDATYAAVGATISTDNAAAWREAQIVLKVQPFEPAEIEALPTGAVAIGCMAPHRHPDRVMKLRDKKITAFAMELVPRVTRAQSMDVLSSQATVAGYKAALLAAHLSGRFFPMLTTAAGTIRPVKALIIGAGVAGLQAIATCRRLGAIVEAYDVRRTTKEQVESLGARFVALAANAEAEGGYARELTDVERTQQQELLARHVAGADVVITTAQIPGRPAPRIVTAEMVAAMKPGAIIVDLAADGGGNCALTKPGDLVHLHGVTIIGPLNLPSELAVHASEMYAKNLLSFLTLLTKEGKTLEPDWQDEVIAGTALTANGRITHEPTRVLVEGGPS